MTSSSANNSILHGLRSCLHRGTVDKVITVNRANSPSYAHLHWCFLKCRTWKSELVLFWFFCVYIKSAGFLWHSGDLVKLFWVRCFVFLFVFVFRVDPLAHWWPCAVLCGFPPSVARSCSDRTLAHIFAIHDSAFQLPATRCSYKLLKTSLHIAETVADVWFIQTPPEVISGKQK